MEKRQKWLAAGAAVAATTVMGTTSAFAASIDFTQFGFPTVAAKVSIPAGQAATLTAGGAKVTIPAGTFTDPVEFELLQGTLSSFAGKAPSGATPIYDFAFKVTDTKTNSIVMAFQKPVLFSYTNSAVNSKSVYYNISTTGAFTANPVPATISGDTLTHAIKGAPVGWVVTSPSAPVAGTTTPITGLPLEDWLLTGAGLIVGGGVLLAIRKKAR